MGMCSRWSDVRTICGEYDFDGKKKGILVIEERLLQAKQTLFMD